MAYALWLMASLVLNACDNHNNPGTPTKITGTGQFTFTSYAPFANKPITCYYHIPGASTTTTPIFIVVPGSNRDADVLRDALINCSNNKKYMVLSLHFPEDTYTGADEYNMANIFQDGDHPTPSTLNPEDDWTFSAIDPIFEEFKDLTGNTNAVRCLRPQRWCTNDPPLLAFSARVPLQPARIECCGPVLRARPQY